MSNLGFNPLTGKFDLEGKSNSELLQMQTKFHAFTGIAMADNVWAKLGRIKLIANNKEFICTLQFMRHNTYPYAELKPIRSGTLQIRVAAPWNPERDTDVECMLQHAQNITADDIKIVEVENTETYSYCDVFVKLSDMYDRYFYTYTWNQGDTNILFEVVNNENPVYVLPVGINFSTFTNINTVNAVSKNYIQPVTYDENTLIINGGWNSIDISQITDSIRCMGVIDENSYIIGCSNGKMYKTIDSGITFIEIQNLPIYKNVNFIKFTTPLIGYSIHELGGLMYTHDGGQTWILADVPTTSVQFSSIGSGSASHACVFRDAYAAYVTFDAGLTWQTASSGMQYPGQMWFINENIGFIVGSAYTGDRRVAKTTDGGLNWVGYYPIASSTHWSSLYALDENTVFLGGVGCIAISYDGGQSWKENVFIEGAANIRSIWFVDENTGYCCGRYGLIAKTIDGGLNWTVQQRDFVAGYNSETERMVVLNQDCIFALNAQFKKIYKTFTGGEDIDYFFNNSISEGKIILLKDQNNKTQNGIYTVNSIIGKQVTIERIKSTIYDSLLIFDETEHNGFILQSQNPIEYGTSEIYFKTLNSDNDLEIQKKSYTVLYTNTYSLTDRISCFKQNKDVLLLYNDTITEIASDNYGIYFISENIGFSYYLGNIKKTTDGGLNWTTVLDTTGINLFHMQFVNESVGYIVSHSAGRVYKTIDGGDNWTVCTAPPSVGSLFCLKFLDENIGFVSGSSRLYKTIDGGINWTTVHTFSNNLWAIDFIDANVGFAAGDNNMLFKTINGGDTWTTHVNFMSIGAARGMHFIGNTGYICKSDGNIYKTIDAGDNWELQTSTTKNVLLDIKFFNENIGYCVGEYGVCYKTTDGGQTWVNRKYNFSGHTLRISIINENLAYISSYSQNRIYKLVNDGFEKYFGVENIETNDKVLLTASPICGIFSVIEKSDLFIKLERYCELQINDTIAISNGPMNYYIFIYLGDNNFTYYTLFEDIENINQSIDVINNALPSLQNNQILNYYFNGSYVDTLYGDKLISCSSYQGGSTILINGKIKKLIVQYESIVCDNNENYFADLKIIKYASTPTVLSNLGYSSELRLVEDNFQTIEYPLDINVQIGDVIGLELLLASGDDDGIYSIVNPRFILIIQ